jgi:hypothetical protein
VRRPIRSEDRWDASDDTAIPPFRGHPQAFIHGVVQEVMGLVALGVTKYVSEFLDSLSVIISMRDVDDRESCIANRCPPSHFTGVQGLPFLEDSGARGVDVMVEGRGSLVKGGYIMNKAQGDGHKQLSPF